MKYKIVRMYRDDRPSKIMYTGFTLEQAQAHCQNPNSSGDGWFDAYEEETEITITGLRSALKRWNKDVFSLSEQDIAKLKGGSK